RRRVSMDLAACVMNSNAIFKCTFDRVKSGARDGRRTSASGPRPATPTLRRAAHAGVIAPERGARAGIAGTHGECGPGPASEGKPAPAAPQARRSPLGGSPQSHDRAPFAPPRLPPLPPAVEMTDGVFFLLALRSEGRPGPRAPPVRGGEVPGITPTRRATAAIAVPAARRPRHGDPHGSLGAPAPVDSPQ